MLYFITGEAEQHLNGKSFIAHDGDLILIRSGDIHATYCEPQEDCRILVQKFLPSIVDPGFLKLETSRYLYAFLNYSSVSDIRNFDCDRLDELKSVLLDIFKEYTNKERAFEIRIRGFIYEFVALLVRYDLISLPDHSVSAKDLDRIGAVIVNMNYSYVSRYFKKVTGRNFKEYLIDAGIDAKHSNEDQIAPFPFWAERYGDRIGNFGGIDTDAVCRLSEPVMREYISDVISKSSGHGGFAFGSGNSIPDYVPVEGYLNMVRIVREIRGENN